jgi:RNA polymerase sigma-70 factor (ECF subfamily)
MSKEEFVRRMAAVKKRLYRTAYLYLGDESGAMEVVDESVYKALKALRKLRHSEYFETWITRILINECKKELKRRSRVSSSDYLPEEGGDFNYDSLPLKEAVARLPQKLRAVVILRYFSGYTLSDAAMTLGIPQGTVVTRQRRALELLRLELVEEV